MFFFRSVQSQRRQRNRRFELETLESRCLLSGNLSAGFVAGRLVVTGSAGSDHIVLTPIDSSRVAVNINGLDQGSFDLGQAAGLLPGPHYLDVYQGFFQGRTYIGAQRDTTGTGVTLAAPATPGATVLSLGTGQGAFFTAGEPIAVGSAGGYQTFTIASIQGDHVTCVGAVAYPGFAAGTAVDHVWANDTHLGQGIADDAWFQAILDARRDGAAGSFLIQDPGTRPVVILGDSWTALGFSDFAAALRRRYPAAQVVNAGVGGNTLNMMARRFASDVLPHNPAYVILGSALMNDLCNNLPAGQILADLQNIANQCRAAGVPLIIPGVAPCNNPLVFGGVATSYAVHDLLARHFRQPWLAPIHITTTAGSDVVVIGSTRLPVTWTGGAGSNQLVLAAGEDITWSMTGTYSGSVGAVLFSNVTRFSRAWPADSPPVAGRLALAVLSLSMSASVSVLGQRVTFTVRVRDIANRTAQGVVTFHDGRRLLGTAKVVRGTARLTVRGLGLGRHTIGAFFSGSGFESTRATRRLTVVHVARQADPRRRGKIIIHLSGSAQREEYRITRRGASVLLLEVRRGSRLVARHSTPARGIARVVLHGNPRLDRVVRGRGVSVPVLWATWLGVTVRM